VSADEKVNVYGGPYHWYLPPFFDFLHRAPLAVFEARVAAGASVLDVGSGDARLTHFLAKRYRVVGIEPQRDAIALGRLMTRLNGTAPGFVQGDAASLPFAAGTFDAVSAFDVIEHLPRAFTPGMLAEARRVLRPGGWLLLTTPNSRSLRNRVLGHRLDPKHYFEFSAEELSTAVRDGGFEVVRLEGCYLPLPLPRIEHYASVIPFRALFRALGRAGRSRPGVAEKLVLLARRPGGGVPS
jgi:SAM-dependent methyltransferase